jgi:IS30 family transposase
MGNYRHLSLRERQIISDLTQQGVSKVIIAGQLKRHRSTINRELVRHQEQGIYSPTIANQRALTTRSQPRLCLIEKYITLRMYVKQHLKKGWSPEQIAGRLKRKKSKYTICHETIYQFIYRKRNKKLFLLLPNQKSKRYRQFARKPQVCRFGNKRIITERANYIDKRFHYGHWEGDRIEFKGERSAAITTLLERKTRLVVLIKNTDKKSCVVMNDISNKFGNTPNKFCQTFTFDQGSEFAKFALLERKLECKVFFCHAHSPWEKGANENMNGRLRRYLPFSKNINDIHQNQLDELSNALNNTPRKCLDFKTPRELFLKHFKIDCRTWF